MKGRPGGIGWLLRHELRMFWYATVGARSTGGKRRAHWPLVAGAMFVWLLLHLGVLVLLRSRVVAADAPAHGFVVSISAALLASFLLMLSSALKGSVDTLFDRGDMDLLLSSPLPSRSIFAVKLGGMTIGIAALYLLFLAPFAHVGVLLGQFRWLAVYPLLLALAALAAASAMLLTLALMRLIGARRTRGVAQVIGALAGTLLFLLSQAGTLMSQGQDGATPTSMAQLMGWVARLDPRSPLLLPARAALGDTGALLGFTALAALAVWATVQLTHRFFVRGLQQAAGVGSTAKRPRALRYRFDRSLTGVVLAKEWRSIARDPQLISQVLLQLLYLLPLCFLIFGKDTPQLPMIGAGLTMLCGSLAAALAWIVLLAEDAPDLLHTAPMRMAAIRRAKLLAVVAPVLALVALPVLWLTLRAPAAGAVTMASIGGAVASAALVNLWTGRPAARSEFTSRNKRNLLAVLFEVGGLLAWGALSLLLLHAVGGTAFGITLIVGTVAAASIALGIPPLAFLLRHRAR